MGGTPNSRLHNPSQPMAEELKRLYQHMTSKTMKDFFLREFFLRDLPFTTEEYEEYQQREDEIVYMVLPNSVNKYEKYCEDVIETPFDLLLLLECPAVMLIHIMGEKMKKQYTEQWEAIEDIRVRYLKRLFALYKEWYRL